MTKKQEEKKQAVEMLRQWLKSGDTVYTVLRHCSRSGMQRRIDLYTIVTTCNPASGPRLQFLSGYAAQAMGRPLHRKGGIVINGCGMDMGFALVDDLRAAVFGYDVKEDAQGRKSYICKGELRQEWI